MSGAKLSGWGNFPRITTVERRFRGDPALVAGTASLIARGNGRAYGDAAINPRLTLSMLDHGRLLAFDPETGRLTCEAGALLSDIVAVFLPRGWFPPVTPGTRLVTIGGMIAADVHGKNHHIAGSFGRHVESLRLMRADGSVVTCSRADNAGLFRATIGGMGLTGVVVEATFRLQRVETAYIRQQTVPAANLEAAMAAFEDSAGWTHSVAWIDCLAGGAALGRSLLYRGEHARVEELPAALRPRPLQLPPRRRLGVPFFLPSATLNHCSVRGFNALYHARGRGAGQQLVDADSFFYPLDAIRDWNRIYGRAGFVQYQCVLPKAASREGLRLLLSRIAQAGAGSFLAVLKLFGPGDPDGGLMSFPLEGYTLALDFPASPAVFSLLAELDAIVADHCGRLYLAKDARMGAHLLRHYPGLEAFLAAGAGAAPFQSALSQRLGLCPQ